MKRKPGDERRRQKKRRPENDKGVMIKYAMLLGLHLSSDRLSSCLVYLVLEYAIIVWIMPITILQSFLLLFHVLIRVYQIKQVSTS